MDFLPLIDLLDENGAAIAGGAAIGLVFGLLAERSAYCTRTAVLDLARGRGTKAMATWALGFAFALLAVQLMIGNGDLMLAETRYLATPQSLSGALIGGLLFGVGMALTRGCVSRLVVLTGTGNLRALFCLAVLAFVGMATLSGFLVPARDPVASLWSTAAIGGNDLLGHLRLGPAAGMVIGAVVLALAVVLAFIARISVWRALGGAGIGLCVAAGWYFTYNLSAQLFDPIPVESLSFVRPVATTGALLVDWTLVPAMDQGLVAGVILGALVGALIGGKFRIQTFSEPGTPSIFRYAGGSALMGFGGVLAGGCTVGAGLSGGSILAVTALLALLAMALGAVVTDRLVDRQLPADEKQSSRAA
ncbi:MAG: YeeE/YedE family protein [Mesorhizobium sp.]|nr:YeeE/YedE family protein [Mesorhizobium sp.]